MIAPLQTTTPRARKGHTCDLCLTPILRDTVHHAVSMIGDGYAYTFRAHLGCWALVSAHPDGGDPDADGTFTSGSFEYVVDELRTDDGSPESYWPAKVIALFDDDGLLVEEQARIMAHLINHARHVSECDETAAERASMFVVGFLP